MSKLTPEESTIKLLTTQVEEAWKDRDEALELLELERAKPKGINTKKRKPRDRSKTDPRTHQVVIATRDIAQVTGWAESTVKKYLLDWKAFKAASQIDRLWMLVTALEKKGLRPIKSPEK